MAYQMSVVTAVERWADWAEAEARTVERHGHASGKPTLRHSGASFEGWAPPQQPADAPVTVPEQVTTGRAPRPAHG